MRFIRSRLAKYRRYLCESIGVDVYSRPSLNQLDTKLQRYLSYKNGFFIEAGANDGFAQSNTYYLERFLGWRGILVEPIPELFKMCVKERANATVFNCALVAADYEGTTIDMAYSNLMSLVKGAQQSEAAEREHIHRGLEIQKLARTYQLSVPARTLSSILDEMAVSKIDFLSLDVESYELNALRGLDLNRYRPTYMLIEANFRAEIDGYLLQYDYRPIDQLSHHDILYASNIRG